MPCVADDVDELYMREGAKTKAFKVSVKSDFESKVLSGELFNQRIKVWKYRPKRVDRTSGAEGLAPNPDHG